MGSNPAGRANPSSSLRHAEEFAERGERALDAALVDVEVRHEAHRIARQHEYALPLQMLAERAEYGRWELARTLVSFGGKRKVWLRRRIIRVQRTL